jgi:hypothetical protein
MLSRPSERGKITGLAAVLWMSAVLLSPEKEEEMSEEERFDTEETEDQDVEAHRRKLMDEGLEQDADENDDVEAHRRR